MNRRTFFGAAAGAPLLPAIPAAASTDVESLVLSISADTSGIEQSLSSAIDLLSIFDKRLAGIRPFAAASTPAQAKHHYRTGYPGIDALRSISAVYKEQMVRALDE